MSRPKPREKDAIVQALRAGVVPRLGLRHIQVGRAREIEELASDIDRVADGGATIRFAIGEYGSGKTFFMNLIRLIALEKGLVVMYADLAPDRRLHATGGQARGLYAEMTRNMSTRSRPDGGALASVVERFIAQARRDAESQNQSASNVISTRLAHLEELTGGYDFSSVIGLYWKGVETEQPELTSAAIRWLRGEFLTRTDARNALGVRGVVDDSNIYDQMKLMSAFVRIAGYNGLFIGLDEMVNLYKLPSTQARNSNYEQILRIINDVLQGSARHLGFLMGGTPEFLMNTRRGLYSYEALQTRLAENHFAGEGIVDFAGPVVRLASLTPEDLFVLLSNIRDIMQDGDEKLPDTALEAFMIHCSERIGEAYFRTPRNTVTAFVNMLSVLEQNKDTRWTDLISAVHINSDPGEDLTDEVERPGQTALDNDDDLTTFRL